MMPAIDVGIISCLGWDQNICGEWPWHSSFGVPHTYLIDQLIVAGGEVRAGACDIACRCRDIVNRDRGARSAVMHEVVIYLVRIESSLRVPDQKDLLCRYVLCDLIEH